MGKKAADEKALHNFVNSDPKLNAAFGDPWAEISKAVEVQKQIYKSLGYLDSLGGFRGDLARFARDIVRAAEQKQKPSNQRIRGFQDSALPTLEQRLFSTAPTYKSLEQALLAESLAEMQDVLADPMPLSTDSTGLRRHVPDRATGSLTP